MNRREFIKTGVVAGSALLLSHPFRLLAASEGQGGCDLVAVRGGGAAEMFRRGIAEMGGMGTIVRSGQSVVVKPNIGWDTAPERGACTNPELVGEVVRQCVAAGAGKVEVLDHTCDLWKSCYRNSGIEAAVKSAGGQMVPANSRRHYTSVGIPAGKSLKDAKVHRNVLAADVFINVPVLKHHGSTRLTLGMKNLMGVVWDRGYWHRNDLHQCIADFSTFMRADLTIMDGYRVMRTNGPMGVSEGDVVLVKAQIIARDPVALDAASARMFGLEPDDVGYIRIADAMKVGSKDLESITIRKVKVTG